MYNFIGVWAKKVRLNVGKLGDVKEFEYLGSTALEEGDLEIRYRVNEEKNGRDLGHGLSIGFKIEMLEGNVILSSSLDSDC